jgi:hypothetical protein
MAMHLYPGEIMYRDKWAIHYDPPPIPLRQFDWHYRHDDFDGAPDAGDDRYGHCASLEECKAAIDEYIADHEEEAA